MLGHRKLNPQDYFAIIKRRGWMIAIPTLLFPIIAYALTYLITPQYISQTLVLIEQQKVPDDYVRPVITEDLDSRLASMREQILSRSSIQPIIERYNLYSAEKMSMDDRIDLVRKSIDIKPIHSDIARSNGLPGFFISFKANDAHTAQLVCGEIQSLFVKQNLLSRAATVDETTEFLKQQLTDAERNLNEQDAKLADFERRYFGKLPSDEGNNINILGSLNTQLQAATEAVSTMENNKSYMEAMLAQQSQISTPSSAAAAAAPAQQKELETLEAQETELSARYQPDYPDLRVVHRKVQDLKAQIEKAASAPAPSVSAPAPPPGTARVDSLSVQDLRARLRALDLSIQTKRKDQAQLEAQVRGFQDRVQSSPQVEEEYKELTRGYQTALSFHDTLLGKINQSKMATDLEHRQQGEQFRVMDEPNLPDSPFYPKRSVFLLGGLAFGIGLGLAVVALLEYRDTALRSERDIWAFTQLPTLAVIAWSGDIAHVKVGRVARLKQLFSRKSPKEALADVQG